jgi:protein O-mannosyl-transferase
MSDSLAERFPDGKLRLNKRKVQPEIPVAPPGSGRGKDIFIVLLFLSLVVVLYFNSLGNGFTNWDDGMIYANPAIRSLDWKSVLDLFTLKKASTYQPVRMLSYAIDYRFWKLNPLGYHLTSLFFYFLTCVTVFLAGRLLVSRILDRPPGSVNRMALFTALLFAVHPVHVESVTWLAARKEVLQGFFFFLSFYLFMRWEEEQEGRTRWKFLGGVLLTFLLAVLSKPSAVVLPAIFLLYEITLRREAVKPFLKRHWPFLVASIVISLVFIFILMKVMVESEQVKPFHGGTPGTNFIVAFYALLYYIKLLAFTTAYSPAYTVTASFSLTSPWTFTAMGVTLLLFFVSIRSRRRLNILFFSFFWFVITLLPFLNLIPISTILADRYALLASFGYCLLVGFLLDRLYGMRLRFASDGLFKGGALCLFLLLFAGYAYMTVEQNKVWKNSFTLWSDAIHKYPEANLANAKMGEVYLDAGKYETALPYLAKAVQVIPTDIISRNNLGVAYWKLGYPERALKEFLSILGIRPDNEMVKFKVAVLYGEQNEEGKAKEILEELIRKNPDEFLFHLQMGYLHEKMGRLQEALAEFERSARIDPGKASPYLRMGDLYLHRLRDPEKAIP